MKKILLSLLVAFSFMFMTTNVVNAEGVAEEQPLKEIDSSILDSIDSIYHIDKKENEIFNNTESLDELEESIKKEYIQIIAELGYDTSQIDNNFIQLHIKFVPLDTKFGFAPDIHKIKIDLIINSSINTKEIEVSYSNTSSYNQADFQYVSNQVSKIEFKQTHGMDSLWHLFETEESDWSNKTNDIIANYDYSSITNDKEITVKAIASGWGTDPDSDIWGPIIKLYFFKNDVLYVTKDINFIFGFGTTLDNGTPIVMTPKDENTEVYKEMFKELSDQGFKNIFGCYELNVYGDTHSNMKVSFTLGNEYNGRGVKILHRKKDNTYETFETKVENGKATITVNEFSPFMIALAEDIPTETEPEPETETPNNAQTSSINIAFYITLALSSLIGITYTIRKIA